MTGQLLTELFEIGPHEVVAFVGGGGKSTLAIRLARELHDAGRPVVVSTTTKMGRDQIPDWSTVCRTLDDVKAALPDEAVHLIGSIEAHKVVGVAPELIDAVAADTGAIVLVEADGARRHPFKAPGANEPVIPASTTLVAIVAGIDAAGGRIDDVCHRPERVAALTGRSRGDRLRPEDMATVLTHPDGGGKGVPPHARSLAVLTKVADSDAAAVTAIIDVIGGRLRLVTVAREADMR